LEGKSSRKGSQDPSEDRKRLTFPQADAKQQESQEEGSQQPKGKARGIHQAHRFPYRP
jgi:hypothetical protein